MIALCLTIVAVIVPVCYYVCQKISALEKRCHDLYMKEIIMNHRANILEETVKQMDVNIMTFSLDLHAHEKKTDEKDYLQTMNKDVICSRMDKLEHEMTMVKQQYTKWLSDSYTNRRRLEGW